MFYVCLFHHHFVDFVFFSYFSVYLCSYSLIVRRRVHSIKCIFFYSFIVRPSFDRLGFWTVSESDDNVSELRSYESNEYDSEEVEIEEEEADEIEESDNDIEVMEILAEAQKQSQIEKQSEPIEIIANNNSNSGSNTHQVDGATPKVCMQRQARQEHSILYSVCC